MEIKPINDQYFTISKKADGEFKDKGSKFISYVFPFENVENLKKHLDEIKSLHSKARHFCFAYKIGINQENSRSNDDGEPSGSAGKPILNTILSNNLSNVLIIVARYFGGTLLGVPGLINAYKSAALEAINNAEIETEFIKEIYQFRFNFDKTNEIMSVVKKFDLNIKKQDYNEICIWDIEMKKSLEVAVMEKIGNYRE